MRVAYLALAPFISGSERSLQLMILYCQELGVEPIVVSPPGSPMHEWATQNDITLFRCDLSPLNIKKPFKWIKTQIRLCYLFLRYRVDLLHSNQIWSAIAVDPVRKLFRKKIVCHFRDPVSESSNWWIKGGINGGIAVSKHIERQIQTSLDSQLIDCCITLINPVRLDIGYGYASVRNMMVRARRALDLDENAMIFGYIGQITPVKGVFGLIQAFAAQRDPDALLIIAGSPPKSQQAYYKSCLELIESLGLKQRVTMLGFLRDVSIFYQAVDVVVTLSKAEPLGRVPLEAGAYFKPSIATRVDGLPETIIDQETGWLIEPNSIESATEAMSWCGTVELDKFGLNARKWVESEAAPDKYAEKVLQFYHRILDIGKSDPIGLHDKSIKQA